jgi:oxygen-dependent protoporphyrinogen oxidase
MQDKLLEGVIVGGGISGLALGHWLRLHERPQGWEIWEASDRAGGTIGTDRAEGYSVDWGPNGFLDREPLTLQLVRELDLDSLLERANEISQNRFIVKRGRLHSVPLSPPAMLKTGLLSTRQKLRVFAEPLVPARRGDADESVYDFAARRIGPAAAETFVDPMVSGVFGGLARQLSLPACFPVMREMELRYGSLVRALIARRRQRRDRNGKKAGGPAGPGGWLTSFRGGLDVLTERLSLRLRMVLRTGCAASAVHYTDGSWLLTNNNGRQVRSKRLVLACPTYICADIMKEFDADLAGAFDSIPYAAIAVLATGHRREDISHPLDGFGFLIPRGEGLHTLGSIWTSSIFTGRAPEGNIQFRTMLGGAGDPEAVRLSDDQLWETVRRELGPIIGIRGEPVFRRTYRWEKGIPQYTIGHRERRARIERLAAGYPGLHMIGNAFYGVGLNDCVKMAHRIADAIARDPGSAS